MLLISAQRIQFSTSVIRQSTQWRDCWSICEQHLPDYQSSL